MRPCRWLTAILRQQLTLTLPAAGIPLRGYSIHMHIQRLPDGQMWLCGKIFDKHGELICEFCIELLYGAVFIKLPTPLHPNKRGQIGGHLTGDCLIVIITIIITIVTIIITIIITIVTISCR